MRTDQSVSDQVGGSLAGERLRVNGLIRLLPLLLARARAPCHQWRQWRILGGIVCVHYQ